MTMTLIAKRIAAFALMVLVGILLLKIVIGAVVGFVKMLLAIALVGLFAFAAFAVLRR